MCIHSYDEVGTRPHPCGKLLRQDSRSADIRRAPYHGTQRRTGTGAVMGDVRIPVSTGLMIDC